MSKILIKSELRKEYAHINGLALTALIILQESTCGIQKIPSALVKGNSGQIKKAVKNLKNATLKNRPQTLIFSKIDYLKGGKISFHLSPESIEFWNKKGFYEIDLDLYACLCSKFSRGLYELLCSFRSSNIRININTAREWLNATTNGDYSKPTRFMNRVLDPAREQIEKKQASNFQNVNSK